MDLAHLDSDEIRAAWSEENHPLEDVGERRVIYAALDSFYQYRKNAHYNTTHRRRQNLYALPSNQWQLLAAPPFSLLDTLNAVDDAIDYNADLADDILSTGLESFGIPASSPKDTPLDWKNKAKPNDISKAHSTVRQFYRDWSAEGFNTEVKPILEIVLSDLKTFLPQSLNSPRPPDTPPRLLLPGAGLGRLLFELCLAGYAVEGNEISYHQLFASNLILNTTQHANQYQIYPFVTTFTNNISRENQLKRVTIPDVHPTTALELAAQRTSPPVGTMDMGAGDFILSYSSPRSQSTFSSVVSVFFIDTAPNLFRYIETVRNCLAPNGVWINFGPLLWHFDDRVPGHVEPSSDNHVDHHYSTNEDTGIAEPGSFELSNDEVILLLESQGFRVEIQEILPREGDNTKYGYGYIQDPTSMLQNIYRCSHWVARKIS